MDDFIKKIELEFIKHADPEIAAGQKAYMKNRFEFYGIKTPVRRKIQKPFLAKNNLPSEEDLENVVKVLWNRPQREYQYFAQEFARKYVKRGGKKDIKLYEYMVTHKSWWDTVDMIAGKLMGAYFLLYPGRRKEYVDKWIASGNMWLQRSAILFQLNYKDKTDTDLLTYIINSLSGSKEFFINKATGWALRNYGKTNPDWVIEFTERTTLSSLSLREALRLIKK